MNSGLFENNVTYRLFAYKSYVYKQDLTLNNPQGLNKHKHNYFLYSYSSFFWNYWL